MDSIPDGSQKPLARSKKTEIREGFSTTLGAKTSLK
ncbi:hypothetical protein CLFO_08810 [Clostridium formicaceticum]|uniref:Uncharacterized protein n=1 Tax=Clostridium formicaceticum TaxID=1497 RepID=A0AAC9RIS4_9CLOT|nr:hypothetical protein CLFO_08810 [Clostridium formicaceticum]